MPPAQSTAATITSAALLASTGGLLDAVVYLDHGHVFANAMTGNVIFLGIDIITRDWVQSIRHLAPILAFLLGVLAARLLKSAPVRNSAVMVLSVEIAALFAVGLMPLRFPQLAFTITVAFVSAFQVTTFRRIGRFTYNSTFVTGNLRDMAEGLFDSFAAHHPAERFAGRAKARKLAIICTAFLLGAAFGAFVARHQPAHAIWFAEPMLLAVLAQTLLPSKQSAAHDGAISSRMNTLQNPPL